MQQDKQKAPSPFYSLCMGAVAYTAEVLTLGHVFDRIKTEQQADPRLRSVRETCFKIYEKGGLPSFYKGLRWNLITNSGKGAIRLCLFNACDVFYRSVLPAWIYSDYAAIPSTLIGLSTGMLETTLILCPLENLKTREMTSDRSLYTMVKQEGPMMLLNGWKMIVIKQSLALMAYQISYEKIKDAIIIYNRSRNQEVPMTHKMAIGAITGAIMSVFSTPFDLLKTQAQKENPMAEKGVYRALKYVVQNYGFGGLFNSLGIKVIRTSWQSCATIVLMDMLGALPKNMQFK